MKITPQEAIDRIPQLQLIGGTAHTDNTPIEYVRSVGVGDESVFLLRQKEKGFVVPSDSDLFPILGEAENADFTLELPPNLAEFVEDYSMEVEWWQSIGNRLPAVEADEPTDAVVVKDVTALCKTKWAQEYPFNYNLKMDDGKRSISGCGAIAMAQLLYFWWQQGYMRGCMATDAYTTDTNKYEIEGLPGRASFDFADMTLTKPTTTVAIKAVADLVEYCGKAAHSDYKPSSTSSWWDTIKKVLHTHFRLETSIIYARNIGLDAYCKKVRAELEKGHPVLFYGCKSTLTGAHGFIGDGYRSKDDKYHINWGWWGNCNGYYALTALTPAGSRNYSYYKSAIFAYPTYKIGDANGDGKINVSDVVDVVDKSIKGEFNEKADVNYDGKVDTQDAQEVVNKILGKG